MLRLAHRILTQPPSRSFIRPDGKSDLNLATNGMPEQIKAISSAVCIVVDEIAFHFDGLLSRDSQRERAFSDFPPCCPPFAELWIEWNVPEHEKEHGRNSGSLQHGFIIETCELENDVSLDKPLPFNWSVHREAVYFGIARLWISDREGNPSWTGTTILLQWNRRGCVVEDRFVSDSMDPTGGYAEKCTGLMEVALLSVSFMHCKNVVRRDVTDSEGPSAKWLRRTKAPEIRYHVLDINPMKEVLRKEGDIEHNGLKKALHICRGHFATYTEERPLFGKVAGTFWVPSHVKGSVEHGIVDKDYRVKAPDTPLTGAPPTR